MKATRTWPAILISLGIHLVLAILLYIAEFNSPKPLTTDNMAKSTPLKSYLYQRPKTKTLVTSTTKPTTSQPVQKPTTTSSSINIKKTEQAKAPQVQTSEKAQQFAQADKRKTVTSNHKQAAPKINYGSVAQLEQFRKKLDANNIAKDMKKHFAQRSHSVMHNPLSAVPHSQQQLTKEQKRAQNTTNYGDDIRIVKLDNGLCVKEQKIDIGSYQSITTSQYFSCGESQQAKYFREHMAKYIKK